MSNVSVKVIDKDGEWFVNTAMFRFVHGTREDSPIFESGVPTRIRPDDWIKSQDLIVKVDNPYEDLPEVIKDETPINGGVHLKDPAFVGIGKVDPVLGDAKDGAKEEPKASAEPAKKK